jgi:hypothetical protein
MYPDSLLSFLVSLLQRGRCKSRTDKRIPCRQAPVPTEGGAGRRSFRTRSIIKFMSESPACSKSTPFTPLELLNPNAWRFRPAFADLPTPAEAGASRRRERLRAGRSKAFSSACPFPFEGFLSFLLF